MATIHTQLVEILVGQLNATSSPLLTMVSNKTTDELCHSIFSSYRESSNQGLKLTEIGLQLMRSNFKSYPIQLAPGYQLPLPHLIYLDRISKMPYWVDRSFIITFDSDLGLMLQLYGGNIHALIEGRYRLENSSWSLSDQ